MMDMNSTCFGSLVNNGWKMLGLEANWCLIVPIGLIGESTKHPSSGLTSSIDLLLIACS